MTENILFAGQRWAVLIAEAVDTSVEVRACHVVVEDLPSLLKFLHRLVVSRRLVRVGFRPGARTKEGIMVDVITTLFALVRGRHSVTFYWIGTDVLKATQDERAARHTPFFKAARGCRHLAGHETLQASLAKLGIPSAVAHVPFEYPAPLSREELASPPTRMTVSTYIPDARPAFYGAHMILDAARSLPDVLFEVFGGEGAWIPGEERPENLRFMGWVRDTRPAYLRATHVARLVEHDSLGGTVLEGLTLGRRVIYTRDMPGVIYVPFGDSVGFREILLAELEGFNRSGFTVNRAGIAIAAAHDQFEHNRDIIVRVACAPPRRAGAC